jgi:DNA polymerase III subunit epsilon
MEINLKNPLVFVDLETTGIDVINDRIVEISLVKVHPNGKQEIKTQRVNPTISIPAEATAVHGITNDDVKDKPTFKEVAKPLAKFMEGCDLAGFNSNKFDFPLLAEEFLRVDVDFDFRKRKFIDVQTIFHKMEKRTLEAAYKFYCEKNLEGAHSAEVDAIATLEVLKAQIARYTELENNVDFLAEFSTHNQNADFAGRIVYNENGAEVFNFGKHKGKTVEEILAKEPSYYAWMMNGDFPLYTKKVLTNIYLRMRTK